MAPCNRSIMEATLADWTAWLDGLRPEEVDPGDWTEAMAHRAALQLGVVPARIGSSRVLYHCGVLDTDRRDQLPGSVLTEGRILERHLDLPDEATKRAVYGARVYRDPVGGTLRSDLEGVTGGTLGQGVPALGTRTQKPADAGQAQAILDAARAAAADESDPTQRLLVAMDEVDPEDVVEADAVYRVRWAGE